MKILAFGASSSKNSINKKFATYATTFFENADIEILNLSQFEMPVFSVDKEKDNGFPPAAYQFLEKISKTDLLIISMAEHNGSYTTAFKNILDWSSRINGKIFHNKPMLLMSTSPGQRGAKSVLESAKARFPFHAANILSVFSLPQFELNFSEDKGITDPELKEMFLESIDIVKKTLNQKM